MKTRRLVFVALLVLAAFGSVGVSLAAFTSTTSNPGSSFAAKRIFPGVRSIAPSDLRDASGGGAEVNASDLFTAAEGTFLTTSTWSTAFAANRWVEWDLNGPLPTGLATSGVDFNYRFAATGAGRTACFYFEVYRRSTMTLIGTHGSSGTPVGCVTGTGQTTFSTLIPEVSTTTIADDLTIRVYGRESTNRGSRVDMATVTGSTPYSAFTLNEAVFRDQADTTLATMRWGLNTSGDGANYQSAANWATAFQAARYLKFSTNLFVPTGATVTDADFVYSYGPNTNGNNLCWYFETYNGTTLLATHGSAGSPISCNTSNVNYVTDTVSIPEVTVAALNNLVIRVYHRNSGARRSQTDLARVDADYYLD